MIYRPHFAYSTPPGCRDEQKEYYFDSTNMTVQTISALGNLFSVIFGALDKDAEFRWRGIKIALNGTAYGLGVRFKDAMGNWLADGTINIQLSAIGAGFTTNDMGGGQCVAWDEEIVCPPGAVIESDWSRELNSTASVPPLPGVTLVGVKRYYDAGAKAA